YQWNQPFPSVYVQSHEHQVRAQRTHRSGMGEGATPVKSREEGKSAADEKGGDRRAMTGSLRWTILSKDIDNLSRKTMEYHEIFLTDTHENNYIMRILWR